MIISRNCILGAIVVLAAMTNATQANSQCFGDWKDGNGQWAKYLDECPLPAGGEDPGTVEENAVFMDELDFADIPVWTDEEIAEQFAITRDQRYLYLDGDVQCGEARRISWLYTRYGCEDRAAQVIDLVSKAGFESRKPYKMWAFKMRHRPLIVYTENSCMLDYYNVPMPTVNWSWHVAPVVKNPDGELFVFDASIEPCRPLQWEEWLSTMVEDIADFTAANVTEEKMFKVAISDYNAYIPTDDVVDDYGGPCLGDISREKMETCWLDEEWTCQKEIHGRTRMNVFGDFPAWVAACGGCEDDASCDDGIPCTVDTCNVMAGLCTNTLVDSEYEAETMNSTTGNYYYLGGWNVYSNGYISFNHTFNGGTQDMTVRAAGSYANGWPHMVVTVGAVEVFNGDVTSGEWNDYNMTFDAPVGTYEVRIHFTNDYYSGPSSDRNLYVDKAIVPCNGTNFGSAPKRDLGGVNAETPLSVGGCQNLVIQDLEFTGWTPSTIVVGIASNDNRPMDGLSLNLDDGTIIDLSGYWLQVEIPFGNQSEINLKVTSTEQRDLRVQWWAQ